MAAKTQESDPPIIATTLIEVVQDTFRKMGNVEFSKDPRFIKRDIIEYESRMRVFGLEKFNGPCYVSSISYYSSQKHQEAHDACGTMNLFMEEGAAGKILKTLGYTGFDDEDETMVLDNCGEFCNVLAGNFKNGLTNLGYKDLYLSAPIKEKNNLSKGAEFPFSQYIYYETEFYLWKQKAVVVDIVMAPMS